MKDISSVISYKGKEYKLVFNLNVMEQIQSEFGTLDEWGKLTDGSLGEPNAKAVISGFTAMLNEGIDIDNDELGTSIEPLTKKQVGRIISEIGFADAVNTLNETVIDSTKSTEKNG